MNVKKLFISLLLFSTVLDTPPLCTSIPDFFSDVESAEDLETKAMQAELEQAIITEPITPAPVIGYLYIHGLGGCKEDKQYFIQHQLINSAHPSYAFNGPEVVSYHSGAYYINQKKGVLGQEDDIQTIKTGLETIRAAGITNLVAIGDSKGAGTLINTASMLKPGIISLIILLEPFADANDVARNVGFQLGIGKLPGGEQLSTWVLKNLFFPTYKPHGIQPLTSINNLPDIPVIFGHSKKDKLIPINHSRKLYRTLLMKGRTNVYLVEMEEGVHGDLLGDSSPRHALELKKAIHAFYKKFQHPYDAMLAQGVDLQRYQPTLDQINERINADEAKIRMRTPNVVPTIG